jgi:hypothetical protein
MRHDDVLALHFMWFVGGWDEDRSGSIMELKVSTWSTGKSSRVEGGERRESKRE